MKYSFRIGRSIELNSFSLAGFRLTLQLIAYKHYVVYKYLEFNSHCYKLDKDNLKVDSIFLVAWEISPEDIIDVIIYSIINNLGY